MDLESWLASAEKVTAENALASLLEQQSLDSFTGDTNVLCTSLITALKNFPDLSDKIAEVFAALARDESFRDVATLHNIIPQLVPLLVPSSNSQLQTSSSSFSNTQLQAMRAIANLCYDHDDNRLQVLNSGGCPLIVEMARQCSSLGAEEGGERLKCVVCGCLLNVANQNETLCKELHALGAVETLSGVLAHQDESQKVVQMALRALATLLDSEHTDPESLLPSSLPSSLSHLLQQCNEGHLDLLEEVMEIVKILVENDRWKVSLVDAGCADHLLTVGDPELQQKATDIIVLLLAEDTCLQKLFEEGRILSQAIQWMETDQDGLEKKTTAALIVANMARNDANCVSLVGAGVVPLLVALIKMEEPEQMSGRLHYAALSALRNLSLPAAHKHLFLQEGVVDAALHALRLSALAHVQFKALGILRLLVDKQAEVCSHLVSQEGTVHRVCEVCASVGPEHVQIEGSRLLAATTKHCHDSAVMVRIAREGGVKWISSLLGSGHALLRNEGLVALNLLATLSDDAVVSSLEEAGVVEQLAALLSSTDNSPEIMSNALVLVDSLCSRDVLRSQIERSPKMCSALQALCKHSDAALKSKAQNVWEQLHDS